MGRRPITRLTLDERRRVYLARQRASAAMLVQQTAAEPRAATVVAAGWRQVIQIAAILTLIFVGLAAYNVNFRLPASLIEVLLPRP
ncbi:MAG: hypothetical protein HYY64_08665 [Candidatus Rokubacteria bacterium]|nr:hypothetical protein [Candidatus Rokubacteria bacterium]